LSCACCAGLYAFRVPVQNWLVNFALDQGFGEIVSTETLSDLLLVESPPPPKIFMPTSPPLASVPTGWQAVMLQDAGVTFFAPGDFDIDPVHGRYTILVRQIPDFYMLDVQTMTAGTAGTIQSEVDTWIEIQDGVIWGDYAFGETPVGPFAWSVGPNMHGDKIFGAVIGPTRDGFVITWWGQAPQDQWDAGVELYLDMIRTLRFTKG